MPVILEPEQTEAIAEHALSAYPEECCGVLAARKEAPERVVKVMGVENERAEQRRRRYLISSAKYREIEQSLKGESLIISGFYHSHPNVEASPSAFDLEWAWPWYTYLLVSVTAGGVKDMRAYILADDRSGFIEQPVLTTDNG